MATPGRTSELLRLVARALIDCLADGGPSAWTKSGRWHRRSRERLFPPAYRSQALSTRFELRHDAAIRSDLSAAAERVLAALDGDGPVRVPVAEADDWIRVLGAGQFLFVDRNMKPDRRRDAGTIAAFLAACQLRIVTELWPDLASDTVLEEA
jgi:hypothetical protein